MPLTGFILPFNGRFHLILRLFLTATHRWLRFRRRRLWRRFFISNNQIPAIPSSNPLLHCTIVKPRPASAYSVMTLTFTDNNASLPTQLCHGGRHSLERKSITTDVNMSFTILKGEHRSRGTGEVRDDVCIIVDVKEGLNSSNISDCHTPKSPRYVYSYIILFMYYIDALFIPYVYADARPWAAEGTRTAWRTSFALLLSPMWCRRSASSTSKLFLN